MSKFCVKHASSFRFINHYSSRLHAANFSLHFDKKPTSPGKPHTWQQWSCCTCIATQDVRDFVSRCGCAVLSYVVAIAMAARSFLSKMCADLAKV